MNLPRALLRSDRNIVTSSNDIAFLAREFCTSALRIFVDMVNWLDLCDEDEGLLAAPADAEPSARRTEQTPSRDWLSLMDEESVRTPSLRHGAADCAMSCGSPSYAPTSPARRSAAPSLLSLASVASPSYAPTSPARRSAAPSQLSLASVASVRTPVWTSAAAAVSDLSQAYARPTGPWVISH